MCDWNEQEPHCHVNSVNRFEARIQKDRDHDIYFGYRAIATKVVL